MRSLFASFNLLAGLGALVSLAGTVVFFYQCSLAWAGIGISHDIISHSLVAAIGGAVLMALGAVLAAARDAILVLRTTRNVVAKGSKATPAAAPSHPTPLLIRDSRV